MQRQPIVPGRSTASRALAALLVTHVACDRAAPVTEAPAVSHTSTEPAQAPVAVLVAPHASANGLPDVLTPTAPATLATVDAGMVNAPDAGSTRLRGAEFLDGDDAAILHRVCDGAIERVQRNTGGTTVSFRVWFEGGTRGLFKPQQQADVANYRSELAAYRLSRLLGIGRVPPACGRSVNRARLQTAADQSGDPVFSSRVLHELLGHGDEVPGAMLYWVPGPLEAVPGADRWSTLLDLSVPLAPGEAALAADLARLVVFDFLTDNVDRWSGGNILRQHLAGHDPGPMLFMDNGAAFTPGADGLGARPREQAQRLAHVQRLPVSLLNTLRALDLANLTHAMNDERAGALLGPAQLRAVLTRRDHVLEHADAQITAHGADAVLVFP